MEIKRWQKLSIERGLKVRRAVLLVGSRQCGKTTLAREFENSDVLYRTLDDVSLARAAEEDPHGFVKRRGARLMIIDEVQRVPFLLQAIKKEVDECNDAGQYLLTGSANISELPSVKESLAGRVHRVRLRTITAAEQLGKKPNFIDNAFEGSFEKIHDSVDRHEAIQLGFKGGYPEALSLEAQYRPDWHRDFINTLLERDLKDIANIKRKNSMKKLVEILASWSAKYINYEAIGRGLQIERSTLEEYVNALETLYLVDRVEPWLHTDYARVGKQDKLYMCDSGLMTSILKWQAQDIEFDSDKIGKLVETFVYNQIAAQVDASSGKYDIYHYRDREKREIDLIIEREDGALLGIEVKSGSGLKKDSFKTLKWFKENIAQERSFTGIVLYAGDEIVPFGPGMHGVPLACL